ncbi:MAG: beta-ketoacyl-ACP synthase II [Gemmatimonadota bacterium]
MTHRRVVVTGIGPVTPIGEGVEGLWDGLKAEESAVRGIDRFDATPFRSRIAAAVEGFRPGDRLGERRARRLDRFAALSLVAASHALEDADLDPSTIPPHRVAVQMGTALGGIAYAEEQHGHYVERGLRGINPLLALSVYGGAASCNIAIEYGFTGPNSTNAMSCASGSMAIGQALRLIRSGEVDVALCGGSEAPLAPLTFGAFAVIRAMSTRNDDPETACRPFDEGRDGFVMGEGAAVLVLEDLEGARARGARIYGEVAGYGTTSDAFHMTQPRPGGAEAARAIELALADAGVAPESIDYVNAHGSSTPLNDSTEALAIRKVLGERASTVPASGTKAYYGHALGASGAIEAAIVMLAIQRGWAPPSLNLQTPGDGCDLAFIGPGGQDLEIDCALSNSFGFGGINASLVFRAFRDDG